MNRCAQVLADSCTAELAKFIENSQPIQIDRLTFNASLKYLLLNDAEISIEISSPTIFQAYEADQDIVIPNGPAISHARLSDFLLGANRVRKQYETVLKLRDSGAATAWVLVSAYYCAYFACIEICKLANRIAISFEADELDTLRLRTGGPHHAKFFEGGQTNFVGRVSGGKIIFTPAGTKPHSAAWENAQYALKQILGEKGWPDANYHIALLTNPDCSPSRIRNTWNYRRADYFGQTGENRASEFRKLVGNSDGATAWLKRTGGRIQPLDPCIVAVLCETLASAVSDAGRKAGDLVRQAAKA